jgi:RNA polymerase sigma factor (sigma-70 family)
MSSAFDLEALLAHDRFVRSLAKSLVLDADRAEDLAQQAWVASLEGRPAGSALRGWLTATVRNLAAKARLADARRRERERRAARPAHVPSDAAIRDREALRREVVEAVLALEEPYKTTVVLRFLEGLPPRAVGGRWACRPRPCAPACGVRSKGCAKRSTRRTAATAGAGASGSRGSRANRRSSRSSQGCCS